MYLKNGGYKNYIIPDYQRVCIERLSTRIEVSPLHEDHLLKMVNCFRLHHLTQNLHTDGSRACLNAKRANALLE